MNPRILGRIEGPYGGARNFLAWNDHASCRRQLGLGKGDRVLVCAGTLWSVKDQAPLRVGRIDLS